LVGQHPSDKELRLWQIIDVPQLIVKTVDKVMDIVLDRCTVGNSRISEIPRVDDWV
jgi:hypothetical protein